MLILTHATKIIKRFSNVTGTQNIGIISFRYLFENIYRKIKLFGKAFYTLIFMGWIKTFVNYQNKWTVSLDSMKRRSFVCKRYDIVIISQGTCSRSEFPLPGVKKKGSCKLICSFHYTVCKQRRISCFLLGLNKHEPSKNGQLTRDYNI